MKKIEHVVILLLGISLSLLFLYPFLSHIHALGIEDWDFSMASNEFTRISFLTFKQFPLWNPYHCGGFPHFANPEISVISISNILTVFFGTIVGIKISILLHIITAFFGFYLLSRHYKISIFGSILATTIFTFSGITGSFLFGGMLGFIGFAYSPYVIFFYLKGERDRKWLLISGLCFALSFYFGYHFSLPFLVYLIFYPIVQYIRTQNRAHLWNFGIFTLCFLLLSLPKLLLSFQLLSIYPRISIDMAGYSLPQLFYFLLSRTQNMFEHMNVSQYTYDIDENSLYVGIIPVILFSCFFFFSTAKQWRKNATLTTLLILSVFLMLGNTIHPSFYNLLKKLPIFSSFRVAQRFRFDFIIPFSLFVGMGLDKILLINQLKKWKSLIFIGIFLVVFFDLTLFNQYNFLWRTLVFNDNHKATYALPFNLIKTPNYNVSYISGLVPGPYQNTPAFTPTSFEFVSLRNGKGTIDCNNIFNPKIAVLSSASPHYHGEWYTQHDSYTVTLLQWTPQAVSVSLKPKHTPAQRDTLILNQNYFPGWFVRKDTVLIPAINTNGLISTVITGEKKIQFIYMPYRALFGTK